MATQVQAGSIEAKLVGEALVAGANFAKQYRTQVLGYVGSFDAKVEAGIVVVENDLLAKLPAFERAIVQNLVNMANAYIDGNIAPLEGDAYDALVNLALTEGQRLEA